MSVALYVRKPELVFADRFGSLLIVIANHAGVARVHLAHVSEVDRLRSPADKALADAKRKARDQVLEHARAAWRRKTFRELGLTARGTVKIAPRGLAEHGTRNRYASGCRCAPCTKANTVRFRERYQPKRTPAVSA